MQVKLGTKYLEFPSESLSEVKASNHLLNDEDALRQELNDKGYLFIRKFHCPEDVLKARKAILEYIQNQGSHILDTEKHSLNEGVLNPRCGLGCVPFVEGKNDLTHCQDVKNVLEGSHVFSFFEKLFGEKALTFDYKWMRAMHTSGFTGAHIDKVYMSRGSQDLLTLWTPFGDVPVNMGVLAVCERSHKDAKFRKFHDTYGECDVEKEDIGGTGWFTEDPDEISRIGGRWKTANFKAGDVIVFNMRLVHMSTANLTDFLRLSCDTRWQPISHIADSRFIGEVVGSKPTYGVYGEESENLKKKRTIASLKESWGFAV